MKKIYFTLIVTVLILTGCGSPTATTTTSLLTIDATQDAASYPLSARGPYDTGRRSYSFVDVNRQSRKVNIIVWYPAIKPAGSTSPLPLEGAEPDHEGALYPLILSSTKLANYFADHLASYGFVVAGINNQDSSQHWGTWLIDYPLDIVFALDQIASTSLEGLERMIDSEHAGAMGYSFDGYTSLALSGARIDPQFYQAQCAAASTLQPALEEWWIDYICNMDGGWENFVSLAGEAITTSGDGLWQPLTDERIRAAMPMAPEGAWIFGEKGLAAVDRPTLIIDGTADDINFYDLEASYIFDHLVTPDKTMISFIGQDHMMIYNPTMVTRMAHFATAFFGYYLQEKNDYAQYFSKEFVTQHNDLAWGIYEEK
jgi:predicted dienelactone hydrolase